MNKQNIGNNMNNFMFVNQMQMPQSPNPMFINNNMGQNMFLSPQFNQIANQQVFPKMNLVLNNNDNKVNSANKNINKDINDKKEKSPLDIIKTTYSVNNEEKLKMVNEIKNIMNKYKLGFSKEDKMKVDYLFEKLDKNL
jgi:prolyl-tRNA synthetase